MLPTHSKEHNMNIINKKLLASILCGAAAMSSGAAQALNVLACEPE